MKVYSQTEPETFAVSGDELRIHWDAVKVTLKDMEDVEQTQWVANEALVKVHDSREKIIEKIIESVYSIQEEIALLNNKDDRPEDYGVYQSVRQTAKDLATQWVNQRD